MVLLIVFGVGVGAVPALVFRIGAWCFCSVLVLVFGAGNRVFDMSVLVLMAVPVCGVWCRRLISVAC